jgi:superfamily II DNA helicase RecQ
VNVAFALLILILVIVCLFIGHVVTSSLKPKQAECLNHNIEGRYVLVNLPVGYGKSVIYLLLSSGEDGRGVAEL